MTTWVAGMTTCIRISPSGFPAWEFNTGCLPRVFQVIGSILSSRGSTAGSSKIIRPKADHEVFIVHSSNAIFRLDPAVKPRDDNMDMAGSQHGLLG